MSITAMKQALEACQLIVSAFDALKPAAAARTEPLQINAAREAITALRTAIAEAEKQEPVAWLTGCPECGMDNGCACDSGTWNPPAAPVQKGN